MLSKLYWTSVALTAALLWMMYGPDGLLIVSALVALLMLIFMLAWKVIQWL